ncbi:hypothetical protein MFLAVUS_007128 [Mucor flavus]|uniref:Uncharacterized protein n=1 Tax=Mucor flavus TaxID=439312 RepID=A0ABP9Z3F8_9FUNG
MSRDEIIKMPDEVNEESPLMRSATGRKKDPERYFFYKIGAWLYTVVLVVYLMATPEKYGQEAPERFYVRFMIPSYSLFLLAFITAAAVPLLILRFLGTPKNTYPIIKNGRKEAMWTAIIFNCMSIIASAACIMSIVGPAFYMYYRHYDTNIASIVEDVVAVTYVVAYYVSYELWLNILSDPYRGILDTITVWQFTIRQIQRRRDTLV